MKTRPTTASHRIAGTTITSVLRLILLCAVVFILAATAGAVLAAAAPASQQQQSVAPATTGNPPHTATQPTQQASGSDLTLARSMVFSGAAALVVSGIGLLMVGRRRRLW